MTERSRTVFRTLATGLVVAVTLPPVAESDPSSVSPLCLVCGRLGTAQLILNVVLFLPLGAAVARPGEGTRGVMSALGWGLLLSAAVEAAQLFVPGRYPAVGDLVANGAGAGIGALLAVSARSWLRPGPAASDLLSVIWGAGAGCVFLTTSLLMQPSLPASEYWVQRAPDLGHLARFRGEVVDARAGELTLPGGRLPERDRLLLSQSLLRGPRLAARARFGAPPPDLAPILSVMDHRQREIFLLGQDGRDLVFRLRRRAADVRLDGPEYRADGLISPDLAGSVATLAVEPDDRYRAPGADGGLCLRIGSELRCGLGHRVGRGWTLLIDVDLPGPLARALDGAWLALFLLPLGYWARPGAGWVAGLLVALGAAAAAPAAGPLLAAGGTEIAGAMAGLLGGAALARGTREPSGLQGSGVGSGRSIP